MSEQDIPALPRRPFWLLNEPDLLPSFGGPRRADKPVQVEPGAGEPGHGAPRAGARARSSPEVPAPPRSGYEQILASRSAMRTRIERAVVGEWGASTGSAWADAPAAEWSREQPLLRTGRRRPTAIVSGLLAVPACVLLAFAWTGPPRSSIAPAAGPAPPGAASLPTSVAVASAEAEAAPVFATRHQDAPWWTGDAESEAFESDVAVRSALASAEAGPMPPAAESGSAMVARTEDVLPMAADDDSGTTQESALSRLAESGAGDGSPRPFAEEEPAVAAWEQDNHPRMVGGGLETPARPAPPAAAPSLADIGPGPVSVEGNEPALLAQDQNAPARVMGARPDAVQNDGAPPPAATAAGAEPASGLPAVESATRMESEGALPSSPAVVDMGTFEPRAEEAAPGADPAFAVLGEDPPRLPAGIVEEAPTARPGTPAASAIATGTVAEAAPAESGGPAAAPPQQGNMAAALVLPPAALPSAGSAPPAKFRAGQPPTQPPPRSVSRTTAREAPPSSAAPDSRCRAIVLKAQLGEETSHAERTLLRSGCGTRR